MVPAANRDHPNAQILRNSIQSCFTLGKASVASEVWNYLAGAHQQKKKPHKYSREC